MHYLKLNAILFMFVIIILFVPGHVSGNVGVFGGFGQTVRMESNAQIQMVSEEIDIYLLRAGGPVTGSLNYLDKARYICKFSLKNLTDKVVNVPVGFPLNADFIAYETDSSTNQTEIISKYNFIAGTQTGSYAIQYIPYDKEKKYGKLFLWTMVFQPNETINLQVNYEMSGLAALDDSTRDRKTDPEDRAPRYLESLVRGVKYAFGYVTTTGKSWAGNIDQATFRIHYGDFEDYLNQRGAIEDDSDLSQHNDQIKFPTMIRDVQPSGWTEDQDEMGSRMLIKTYSNFVPEEGINISYLFCKIPSNLTEYKEFIRSARETAKKELQQLNAGVEKIMAEEDIADKKKRIDLLQRYISEDNYLLSPSGEKEIADTILEFYGHDTKNQGIAPFLSNQTWYPVTNPPEMDEELQDYLQQIVIK